VGRSACHLESESREALFMLHAGLDLSRRKVDLCLVWVEGGLVDEWAEPPDADTRGP
jgi:hypothetical protein